MSSENPKKKLLRDVGLFQVKLLVDGLRDVALSPISLVAAAIDLLGFRLDETALFYQVLHAGKRSEKWIDLFSAAKPGNWPDGKTEGENLDTLITRLEVAVTNKVNDGGLPENAKNIVLKVRSGLQSGATPTPDAPSGRPKGPQD